MACKWISSCLFILVTMKATESNKLIMGLTKQQENYYNTASIKNLTAVTWAHAVNSQNELNFALKSDVEMIEADIVLGKLINDTDNNLLPVMGHPPANTSDISLDSFLHQIWIHNNQNNENKKGVKLDFKSTKVFESSINILKKLWPQINYPVWLNADIIKGPVNADNTKPVDPKIFLDGCKDFNTAILSLGWTTKWGNNYTEGSYSDNYINEMLEIIRNSTITTKKHKITFPVRAGIAAQSQSQLHYLVKELNSTNEVTLTIWSSHNDHVNIEKLRNLIFSFGFDRVYLDVPDEVSSKLNLGDVSLNQASTVTSFVSFSIISLCLLALSVLREFQF